MSDNIRILGKMEKPISFIRRQIAPMKNEMSMR